MQFFRPRTRPKTFLQYFSSEQRKFKAKHCGRNKKFIKLRKYKKNVGMHVRANLNESEKNKFEKGDFQAKIQLVKVLVHVSIVKQDLHNKKYVGFERFMFWVLKFWASKECTLMLLQHLPRFVMKKTTIEKDRNGKSSRGKSSQYIGRPH